MRQDRPARRGRGRPAAGSRAGGVAVLYREYLSCDILPIVSDSASCESLWVTIGGGGRRSVTVGVVYRPPSQPTADGLDQLHAAVATGRSVFYLGDFNVNLLCPSASGSRQYLSILNDLCLSQLISSLTHFEPAALLDHIITNVSNLENSVTVPSVPIADHLTVMVRVPFCRAKPDRSSFRARPWRRVNWDALCLHLLQADWDPMYQAVGINAKLEKFMCVWSDAIDVHCPMKTVTPRRPHCPWLEDNPEIRQVMDERDQTYSD